MIGTGAPITGSVLPIDPFDQFRATDPFQIPTPFGPIEITVPGGCAPLETCSGPTVAGVCLGSCVPFGFQLDPLVPGQPPPAPPTAPPQVAPQIGGCPPRAGAVAGVLCPAGCHANKAGYFLKGGSFVAKGTKCVRNRRRNPLNPRALDRAASRLRSAKRIGTFLSKVKIPKKC